MRDSRRAKPPLKSETLAGGNPVSQVADRRSAALWACHVKREVTDLAQLYLVSGA
jgi:hypothetical protein